MAVNVTKAGEGETAHSWCIANPALGAIALGAIALEVLRAAGCQITGYYWVGNPCPLTWARPMQDYGFCDSDAQCSPGSCDKETMRCKCEVLRPLRL
jgi:hypothetical protein